MAPEPVHVGVEASSGTEHDDLMAVLRHQESLGGLRLVESGGEVVHALGWAGARRAARSPAPWVLTPPRMPVELAPSQRSLLLSADAVVVRTSQQRDAAHAAGVPWYRLFVVPVAADPTTYARSGPAARNTERYRIVVEATGSDDGIATVLAAVATWDAAELVIVAGQRAATLRREARRAGLADRSVVVQPRDGAERAWWLRSAHAVVAVPSGGVPPSIALDAMACGIAVVATSVDQLEDLVVHGVTGLHVPVGDATSLAHAVRSIVADPFRLEAFGMAAADRALNRYSPERVGRDLVAVYRRLLVGRTGLVEADAVDLADADAVDVAEAPVELDGAAR